MNTTNIVRQSVGVALVSLLAGCASWNGMSHQAKATTEGATGGALVGGAVAGPVGAAVGAGVGGVVAHNNAQSIPTPNLPTAHANTSSTYSSGAQSDNGSNSNAATRNETPNPSSANAATGTANSTNANPQTNESSNNMNNNNMSSSQLDNDHQVVREAQRALNDKGFSAGAADGIMGPHTEKALRDFQQAQGLDQTGNLDQQTLSALGVQP